MEQPSPRVERVEADGTWYELPLSAKPSNQNGGYAGVFKPAGGKLFHARTTLTPGGGQTVLHGAGCAGGPLSVELALASRLADRRFLQEAVQQQPRPRPSGPPRRERRAGSATLPPARVVPDLLYTSFM